MLTIVDYGMGNLGSILNMLKKIGVKGRISSSSDDIRSADSSSCRAWEHLMRE